MMAIIENSGLGMIFYHGDSLFGFNFISNSQKWYKSWFGNVKFHMSQNVLFDSRVSNLFCLTSLVLMGEMAIIIQTCSTIPRAYYYNYSITV
jgi:hypothetical protein